MAADHSPVLDAKIINNKRHRIIIENPLIKWLLAGIQED
jgi:hypothetical protein